MTKIKTNGTFTVEYNGKSTWLLFDLHGDCYGYFSSERTAINAYNRTCKAANIAA